MFRNALRGFAAAIALVWLAPTIRAEEKGPNGGVLYEAAKHKYHIELKVDAANKSVTAYVLDDKAKNAVSIKAKTIVLKIKGMKDGITLTGVAAKDSDAFTQFQGKSDALGGKLDFGAVTIEAKVEEGKPALTFELDD